MTLEKAIEKNPYDPQKGTEAAYIRYLRYTVDGFYTLSNEEVKEQWEKQKESFGNNVLGTTRRPNIKP